MRGLPKRARITRGRDDQQAILADLHLRRPLLAQRRKERLAGNRAAFVPQLQHAIDSAAVMAKRWRWLLHSPHALNTLRAVVQSLPPRNLRRARHVLEYVNRQVDIDNLESNWARGCAPRPDGSHGTSGSRIEFRLARHSQQRSTVRMSSLIVVALVRCHGAASMDQTQHRAPHRTQQPQQSAFVRARQYTESTFPLLEAALGPDAAREDHNPVGLLVSTKSDKFFAGMLKAFGTRGLAHECQPLAEHRSTPDQFI